MGLLVAIAVTIVGLASFALGIAALYRHVAAGQPAPGRLRPIGRRTWTLITTVLTHREFKSRPAVRVAHWLVMVSFPVLFLTLITGYGQLTSPLFALPVLGTFAPWEWLVEFFAWGGLLGILALVVVRLRLGSRRGSRFYGSARWQAWFVEAVIALVVIAVLGLRACEYALAATTGHAPSAWHFPFTAWLGSLLTGASPAALAVAITILATLKIVVSMVWMAVVGRLVTMGVAWHRFLAIVNLYARREPDGGKALGAAAPLLIDGKPLTDPDELDELDEDARLGVGFAEDFTWKARLDFSSCTECGRCQDLCPAWNTGKPLSPKLLTLSLRDHLAASPAEDGAPSADTSSPAAPAKDASLHSPDVLAALIESGNTGPGGVARPPAPLVGDVVCEDALWDCTMCGACVDQCPVDIEHVDHILNLRRHQVLMESAFPRELARPMRSMESKANPYNQPARKRLEWAKSLDFDVPVIGQDVEDASEVDWLFWVGCAGAYDDRAKKTTAAIARLLHHAGVRYAVLGSGESCTGDPARRAGNEVLFQMLARQAIDTLEEARAKRIVVSCAHCFNTIANEFPELGGTYQVVHHTQLLNRLVREGHLRPVPPPPGEAQSVTFHDPCYLGRHNQVFAAPRELLAAGTTTDLREMARNRERALCCGAGGARAWMEETRGTRIAGVRMAQAAETGASVVATACPFCSQMLGSAPAAEDVATPVVKDVAVLLWEAVERGLPSGQADPLEDDPDRG